jgi:hypothetical protein
MAESPKKLQRKFSDYRIDTPRSGRVWLAER